VWSSVEAMRTAGRTLIDPDDASKCAVQVRICVKTIRPCMASVVVKTISDSRQDYPALHG
jgi:hypothetical protein